jgi:hypothetical protein
MGISGENMKVSQAIIGVSWEKGDYDFVLEISPYKEEKERGDYFLRC